ncbi:membrane-spanning 4-domains subfamily A member 4D-like isoform X1 [Protopterus annectens]|uniref:membrane-spanning 4-domains subfamily A member 4D-like isoform X1 n=1 Tax=Protopterus annectens TaxID=7888 RepID=UPI001CF96D71|nr:membrane-spanning 4-domains subfamily A member 4D-like isoform X1 [Protopterus annectens]XP_043917747.1 membrane-spanning 4-domains subfamily A member 4D-like isoform X1 [Protopterus annectens]
MNVIDSNSTANVQSVPGSSRSPTYHNVTPVTATNISPKSNLQKFIAGDPKALGTTQIMIGIVTITMGIALSMLEFSFVIDIGLPFWSSALFITSGALTVAAGNYRHFCIVNTSMAFNIVSSVIAVISIILYSINFALHGHFSRYSSILNSQVFLAVFLLIFALLEFSICIAVSIYSCKATCSCTDSYAQMPVVVVQYNANPETHTVPPVP